MGAVAYFTWRLHLNPFIAITLAAGVVASWFIDRRFTAFVLGLTLLASAILDTILNTHSGIGYTAATLAVLTGAIIAWRQ